MGQMASLLTERHRGALPSSGKELAVLGQPPVIGEVETEEVIQPSQTDKVVGEQPHWKKVG